MNRENPPPQTVRERADILVDIAELYWRSTPALGAKIAESDKRKARYRGKDDKPWQTSRKIPDKKPRGGLSAWIQVSTWAAVKGALCGLQLRHSRQRLKAARHQSRSSRRCPDHTDMRWGGGEGGRRGREEREGGGALRSFSRLPAVGIRLLLLLRHKNTSFVSQSIRSINMRYSSRTSQASQTGVLGGLWK
uniref:Uncharacterized protein n=1 Tax=Knipowitschia caucasica TaxID=637954 RepID=A0AAV2LTJ8_KNICA